VTVALDTEVTDELLAEGLAREVVKRIQNLRKEAGFEVTDRIAVEHAATPRLADAIARYEGWIRNETLALELRATDQPDGAATGTFALGDEDLALAVRRASNA
jgi:isoleucyl-tRNA synthetase